MKFESLKELIDIVITLRSDNGCEWDKKQTPKSLTPHLIEETHEVVDAILDNDTENLKEELGDLLLHIIFQAVIASERDQFQLDDIIKNINKKLTERHPHIFDKNFKGDEPSKVKNWELNKKKEKKRKSILDGVPNSLPSLIVSQRYQDKTGAVGFEWENSNQAMLKVDEELNELKNAIKNNDYKNIEEEIGDLLITVVNIARFFSVSAELALKKTNKKFYRRFHHIERVVNNKKQNIEDLSLKELLNYWEEAKNEERSN
jgi:tetrapyrrole methylase family protein/MazG family protein